MLTGVIDNEKLKKNYLLALKNEAIAYPNYKRLDVERQTRTEDSAVVGLGAHRPEQELRGARQHPRSRYRVRPGEPTTPRPGQPPALPPSRLLDRCARRQAGSARSPRAAQEGESRLVRGTRARRIGGSGRSPDSAMAGGGSHPWVVARAVVPSTPARWAGVPRPWAARAAAWAGSGGASMPGGGSAANPEETNFTKYEDPSLMLRSLDFTVEPDKTYRFRVRIVVVNPNKDHEDVNPGVDTTSKELLGPWSDPTDEVTIPADVAAYTMLPEDTNRRDDLVLFQVVRWDQASGQTLIKNDTAGPGELVGEYGSVSKPDSDGAGAKPTNIDFNSRAIVLDTMGGRQRLPDIGVERNQFEVPAVAMLVEPDGSVVIRSSGPRQGGRGSQGHGSELPASDQGFGKCGSVTEARACPAPEVSRGRRRSDVDRGVAILNEHGKAPGEQRRGPSSRRLIF